MSGPGDYDSYEDLQDHLFEQVSRGEIDEDDMFYELSMHGVDEEEDDDEWEDDDE